MSLAFKAHFHFLYPACRPLILGKPPTDHAMRSNNEITIRHFLFAGDVVCRYKYHKF